MSQSDIFDVAEEDALLALHAFVGAAPRASMTMDKDSPRECLIQANLEYRGQMLPLTVSSKTTLAEVANMFGSWMVEMKSAHEAMQA